MQSLLKFLDSTMKVPTIYGLFHLIFIGIVIITTFILCHYFKNSSSKTFNKIMFISWIIIIVLEAYKQLVFSYSFSENNISWKYQWYSFPFQFCSSPIYVLPFIFLIKNEKIKDIFVAFVSSFCFFGGLVVYLYPGDVFTEIIGINFQTMIHHGLQIVLGIFCTVYYRDKFSIKWWYKSIFVFIGLVITALILNFTIHSFLQSKNMGDTFNMFFISPYFDCTLPILSIFYDILPYVVFLLLYIFGFSAAAFIVCYIKLIIIKYHRKKHLQNV